MQVIVCDRCGKKVKRSDWSPIKFPYIKIEKVYDMDLKSTYDLCDDCQQKLEQWLRKGDSKGWVMRNE